MAAQRERLESYGVFVVVYLYVSAAHANKQTLREVEGGFVQVCG